MAEIRSDNRLELHPKPTQEYERRFNGTTWVDWTDFAQMEAVYNVAYRLNKYFWVAGVYYQCYGNSLYRAIAGSGGGNATILEYIVTADAPNITVAGLSGKTMYMVVQGSTPYTRYQVIQTGTLLDFTAVGGVFDTQVILIFCT